MLPPPPPAAVAVADDDEDGNALVGPSTSRAASAKGTYHRRCIMQYVDLPSYVAMHDRNQRT